MRCLCHVPHDGVHLRSTGSGTALAADRYTVHGACMQPSRSMHALMHACAICNDVVARARAWADMHANLCNQSYTGVPCQRMSPPPSFMCVNGGRVGMHVTRAQRIRAPVLIC